MGKKRIIKKEESTDTAGGKTNVPVAIPTKSVKNKVTIGILYIQSTYNNTLMTLTDDGGNALFASSSGAMGFKGAKKGTPFASAKVANILAEKAINAGIKNVSVVVKGVGAGRESAIRSFAAKGIEINNISDVTPIPHNGPKPPKPRRV